VNERNANWQGMNWIRQEKRLAIYLRDGMACAYCSAGVEQGARLTLDHIVPVESGGRNAEVNLITACDRCNAAKGVRNLAEFIRATAAYLNNGVLAIDIHRHVLDCCARELDLDRAKLLIAERGSAAKALAHLHEKGASEA